MIRIYQGENKKPVEPTRLEQLYRRRLVSADTAGKNFPERFVLSREVAWFPVKPDKFIFDLLEIGPGRGDFMFHLATEHPDKTILAIERGDLRFRRLCDRLKKAELKNVTLIGGDARIPLAKDLKTASFEKIYVLFPDPWPRNRHRHRRLMNKDFTISLCDRLKPGGEFTLATDVADYADWVIAHFRDIPQMTDAQGRDRTLTPPPDLIPTFFEEKWRKLGRACQYVRYRRENRW